DSTLTHRSLGDVLLAKHDVDGAVAEYREAIRLRPDDPSPHVSVANALKSAGRNVEAYRVSLDALKLNVDQTEDPRKNYRYDTARLAMNCADGKGRDAPPPSDRASYRKQARELLTAELSAIRKLAASDKDYVFGKMQRWLVDADLASARNPTT